MGRYLAASTCAVCITLWAGAPAAARRADPSAKAGKIESLRDFDECQEAQEGTGSELCLDGLKAYTKAHPEDAFEAGKRARRHYMHWVALDFFVQALSTNPSKSKKQCADDDVSAAVLSGLALPARYPAVAQAQKLVMELCPRELESVVASALKSSGNTFRSNACSLVPAKRSGKACDPANLEVAASKEASAPVEPAPLDPLVEAPKLRQAPPKRVDPLTTPQAQKLEQVFPSIPEGQPNPAPPDQVAELKGLDWKLLSLDPDSAEVLRGAHGEEVMLARTKPGAREYVLLKFKGIKSPWNERVLVAIERNGAHGKDYVIALDGRATVVMMERQRQYQAFPKGVVGGVWLTPTRPSEQTALQLPQRRDVEHEFATAASAL